jgi:4-amino-4-deoxy-L-arabinose transferase-like glycosyltransferase
VRGSPVIVPVAIAALYLASISTSNPPGFFHDESDIAFNAASIADSGRDEHGAVMPLYFSSFGDWKSGPYIYLLAGVFRIFGPSELAARALSATLGLAAVALLGLLGYRLSGKRSIGLATAALAAATPWLFEVTRLVFEVALEPVLVAALLLVLAGGRREASWSPGRCTVLGLILGLIADAYAAGRLLAPLLAIALVVFATRDRWRSVALTWTAFAIALVPMAVFQTRHPHALFARYRDETATLGKSLGSAVWTVLVNEFHGGSLWRWAVFGDANPRHHVQGTGSLLVVGVLLALGSVIVVARRERWDAFWAFVVAGAVLSVAPSALTARHPHALRSIGLPVFLVALAVPGLEYLRERSHRSVWRVVAAAVLAGGAAQFALFETDYWHDGPRRLAAFDAQFPAVFHAALATGRPVVAHRADYTVVGDGLWYARLWHRSIRIVEPGRRPPQGSVVVSSIGGCAQCRTIGRGGVFRAYLVG